MKRIGSSVGGPKKGTSRAGWKPVFVIFITILPATTWALPDLTVRLSAPESTTAAADIGEDITVTVVNRGTRGARGTESTDDGYMVDLFITRGDMPVGYARYNEHYFDGVLLRGGRISNTDDLPARQGTRYSTTAMLPSDIPPGRYRLCARVDPGATTTETNEDNNTHCVGLRIRERTAVRVQPDFGRLLPEHRNIELQVVEPEGSDPRPDAATPSSPVGTSEATRTILDDGSIVLSWPDGSQRRLRPDGLVEYVTADGSVMSPMAMQVQGADLPALPEPLSDWGTILADDLLLILGNILTDAEIEAFRQTEEDKNYYELVDWRLRSIRFLTAPGESE